MGDCKYCNSTMEKVEKLEYKTDRRHEDYLKRWGTNDVSNTNLNNLVQQLIKQNDETAKRSEKLDTKVSDLLDELHKVTIKVVVLWLAGSVIFLMLLSVIGYFVMAGFESKITSSSYQNYYGLKKVIKGEK